MQQSERSCPEDSDRDRQRGTSAPLGKHTNMAAKSLFSLLCILSGIAYPASAARLGEQQQTFPNVRQICLNLLLAAKLCMLCLVSQLLYLLHMCKADDRVQTVTDEAGLRVMSYGCL